MKRWLVALSLLIVPIVAFAHDDPEAIPVSGTSSLCPNIDLPVPEEARLTPEQKEQLKPGLPGNAKKSCSGVNCGCDIDQQWCLADCPPEGDPYAEECRLQCGRQYRLCAICCCDPSNWRCGG